MTSVIEDEQHFQFRFYIQEKLCSVIINWDSCSNIVSPRVVSKLNLEILEHNQVKVPISINKYKHVVYCKVQPMETCHILLGRPWMIAHKATMLGPSNTLYFWTGKCVKTLVPLSLDAALEDQNKLRKKIEQERKEEEIKELELREKEEIEKRESELRAREREEEERREKERKEKELEEEERKEREKEEIQNFDVSNMFSISSSYSLVHDIGRQVEIIPSAPLFIQPNFGNPLQWKKENKCHTEFLSGKLLHNQALDNNILNSWTNSLKEEEYDIDQAGTSHDSSNKVWSNSKCAITYLILLLETDKIKYAFVKFVFDPGGDQDIHQ